MHCAYGTSPYAPSSSSFFLLRSSFPPLSFSPPRQGLPLEVGSSLGCRCRRTSCPMTWWQQTYTALTDHAQALPGLPTTTWPPRARRPARPAAGSGANCRPWSSAVVDLGPRRLLLSGLDLQYSLSGRRDASPCRWVWASALAPPCSNRSTTAASRPP